MDPKLRKHILDESQSMLSEARRALESSVDSLMKSIHDVESGDYHPLRKEFHRKAMGSDAIEAAKKHMTTTMTASETRNTRALSSSSTGVDDLSARISRVQFAEDIERDRVARLAEEEARRVEDAHASEMARIDAERALDVEREELLRVEMEKAELLRLEAAKAERERLEAQRALDEEKRMLAKLAQEKEALRQEIEREKQALEKIERDKAVELECKRKELEERLEQERLDQERQALALLEAQRIAKESAERAERDRVLKEQAEREERERVFEQERRDWLARQEAERQERIATEEAERKAQLEKDEQERRERFAKQEAEQKERFLAAEREHQEKLLALEEAARLEKEAADLERSAMEESMRVSEKQEQASQLLSNTSQVEGVADDEERALREAIAERELLERSMAGDDDDGHHQNREHLGEEEDDELAPSPMRHEEERHRRQIEQEQGAPPSALDSSFQAPDATTEAVAPERKYVTIQDRMLQPRKRGLFWKAPRERVLVLREDKFRYFDETKTQLLGGLSLAEEGVEVVLTALKKSPSGVALRFSSPSVGTLEFYPATVEMGRKWISAIEHNMEMRYELPDLGPEEAPTYYDYLGVPPEEAEPATLLQAYADRSRSAQDEWHRAKLNEALQVLHDPFKKVEYDNFVTVQRRYRFGAPATVQIRTPRGESTDPVESRVFTDANFSHLYWQDGRLGPSLTGRHLCVELARIQEVQPGPLSNSVQLVLNNGEVLMFSFQEKREAEDFGAAVRFAKAPQLSMAKRRQSVQETSV